MRFEKRGSLRCSSLCCEKERKKERKKKKFGANRCSSFFQKKKSREESCRFVFFFSSQRFSALFLATNSIRTLVVFCVAQRAFASDISNEENCGTKRASAHTLFEFFFLFVCLQNGSRADNFYARGKSDETLVEICRYTFCARARSLLVNLNPSKFFFFQTITF